MFPNSISKLERCVSVMFQVLRARSLRLSVLVRPLRVVRERSRCLTLLSTAEPSMEVVADSLSLSSDEGVYMINKRPPFFFPHSNHKL